MGVYLGHDKVAGPGAFCNVSGKASKNLYDKRNAYVEGASNQNAGNNILVLPNTTYTFSIGKYTYGEVKEFDNSGVQINDIGGSESSKIITFTTSSNAKYITTLFFTGTYNNVSLNEIDFTQIQFEKGSTATEYEEYYEPTISIRTSDGTLREVPYAIGKASKNLFDKATMVEFTNGYRLYTNGTFNNNSSFYGLKIPVQPNTTYTSSSDLTDTNLWSDLCFFDKSMNFISGVEGRANKTFTTPANCYFVTYAIYNQYQWFQLEKGSTITSYEEYFTPELYVRNSNGIFQMVGGIVSTYYVDKNGWTVLDYGTYKEYLKYVEFTISVGASAWNNMNISNLPEGVNTLGNRFLSGTCCCRDAAIDLNLISYPDWQSINVNFRNKYTQELNKPGQAYLRILEIPELL